MQSPRRKPIESLEYPQLLFSQAGLMLNILRDHIATLGLVLEYLSTKIPNGYETTIATRLDNHKKVLDTFVKRPDWIHDKPVTPFELIHAVQKIEVKCAVLLLQANAAADRNPELMKCTTAIIRTKSQPSLKTYAKWHRYYSKARKIAPDVISWIEMTETAKRTLGEIHETINFLIANITDRKLYNTELVPRELTSTT